HRPWTDWGESRVWALRAAFRDGALERGAPTELQQSGGLHEPGNVLRPGPFDVEAFRTVSLAVAARHCPAGCYVHPLDVTRRCPRARHWQRGVRSRDSACTVASRAGARSWDRIGVWRRPRLLRRE